jgi:hypothetical protein
MEQAIKTKTQLRGVKPKVAALEAAGPSAAQAYALRIWAGQSADVLRHERIARVAAGLAGQGMTMDGVELPQSEDVRRDEEKEAKARAWAAPLPTSTEGIV